MAEPLRIGIAGLGTVGGGVVELLRQNGDLIAGRCGRPIEIVAVSARNKAKHKDLAIGKARWCDNPLDLADAKDVDVVVELIGGEDGVAKSLCEAALKNGKPVVTANKALLAHHGAELAALAEKQHVPLMFEASVAGGIPVIKTLREGLAANRISRVTGILNGTCNYILTTMEKTGRDFADVLKEAQAKGYAEADPGLDIDGFDTAHKLAILSWLAFGFAPSLEGILVEGIRTLAFDDVKYAAELGYRIKLLGIAAQTEDGVEQRVHPCMIPFGAPLATVDDAYNAVQIEGDQVGRIFLEGRGAGAGPTASSVVADLMDIARGTAVARGSWLVTRGSSDNASRVTSHASLTTSYYLRLTVYDKPGVLAGVAGIFLKDGISVRSVIQHESKPGAPVQVIFTTHKTKESSMQKALKEIAKLDTVIAPPHVIRMEEG